MKILLITGKQFDEKAECTIENGCVLRGIVKTNLFKINKDKLAHIYPAEISEISIKNDHLINFSIKSIGNDKTQIPNLSPIAINEILSFLNDFKPDIINSYDDNYLGVLGQIWAIQKKIPFVFTHSKKDATLDTKTFKLLHTLFQGTGIGGEFIKNFYHNCTSIIITNLETKKRIEEIHYEGSIFFIDLELDVQKYLEETYKKFKKIIVMQPAYIKSNLFKKILRYVSFGKLFKIGNTSTKKRGIGIGTVLFAGGAIATSLIAYSTWKGLNIIKNKISKRPN